MSISISTSIPKILRWTYAENQSWPFNFVLEEIMVIYPTRLTKILVQIWLALVLEPCCSAAIAWPCQHNIRPSSCTIIIYAENSTHSAFVNFSSAFLIVLEFIGEKLKLELSRNWNVQDTVVALKRCHGTLLWRSVQHQLTRSLSWSAVELCHSNSLSTSPMHSHFRPSRYLLTHQLLYLFSFIFSMLL